MTTPEQGQNQLTANGEKLCLRRSAMRVDEIDGNQWQSI